VIGEDAGTQGKGRGDTLIYLAGADGANSRQIARIAGEVQSASMSSDGRWLLVVAQRVDDKIERSAWLVPVPAGTEGAQQAAREIDSISWDPAGQAAHLEAAFVPGDKQPAQVVVDRVAGVLESLTVYNAEGTGATSTWTITGQAWNGGAAGAGATSGYNLAGFSNGGGYLASRRQDGVESILELWSLSGGEQGSWWSLSSQKSVRWWSVALPPLADRAAKVQFAPQDDYILASVANPGGPDGHDTQAIYAAAIKKEGGMGETKLIATARQPSSQYLPTFALGTGGSLLAYVDTGDKLHVVFYDGKLDTPLAGNVGAVWSLGSPLDLAGKP